jgi:hypothetical protein
MKGHIESTALAHMSQDQLLKCYAEGVAQGAMADMKDWKTRAD